MREDGNPQDERLPGGTPDERDRLRGRLWELAYGLADDDESRELLQLVENDPLVARVYADVQLELKAVADAARLEADAIPFAHWAAELGRHADAPLPSLDSIARGAAASQPGAASPDRPLEAAGRSAGRATAGRGWRRAAQVLVSLAAAGLLFVGWSAQRPRTIDEQTLAARFARYDIQAPAPAVDGDEWTVFVTMSDAKGAPLAGRELRYEAMAADDKTSPLKDSATDSPPQGGATTPVLTDEYGDARLPVPAATWRRSGALRMFAAGTETTVDYPIPEPRLPEPQTEVEIVSGELAPGKEVGVRALTRRGEDQVDGVAFDFLLRQGDDSRELGQAVVRNGVAEGRFELPEDLPAGHYRLQAVPDRPDVPPSPPAPIEVADARDSAAALVTDFAAYPALGGAVDLDVRVESREGHPLADANVAVRVARKRSSSDELAEVDAAERSAPAVAFAAAPGRAAFGMAPPGMAPPGVGSPSLEETMNSASTGAAPPPAAPAAPAPTMQSGQSERYAEFLSRGVTDDNGNFPVRVPALFAGGMPPPLPQLSDLTMGDAEGRQPTADRFYSNGEASPVELQIEVEHQGRRAVLSRTLQEPVSPADLALRPEGGLCVDGVTQRWFYSVRDRESAELLPLRITATNGSDETLAEFSTVENWGAFELGRPLALGETVHVRVSAADGSQWENTFAAGRQGIRLDGATGVFEDTLVAEVESPVERELLASVESRGVQVGESPLSLAAGESRTFEVPLRSSWDGIYCLTLVDAHAPEQVAARRLFYRDASLSDTESDAARDAAIELDLARFPPIEGERLRLLLDSPGDVRARLGGLLAAQECESAAPTWYRQDNTDEAVRQWELAVASSAHSRLAYQRLLGRIALGGGGVVLVILALLAWGRAASWRLGIPVVVTAGIGALAGFMVLAEKDLPWRPRSATDQEVAAVDSSVRDGARPHVEQDNVVTADKAPGGAASMVARDSEISDLESTGAAGERLDDRLGGSPSGLDAGGMAPRGGAPMDDVALGMPMESPSPAGSAPRPSVFPNSGSPLGGGGGNAAGGFGARNAPNSAEKQRDQGAPPSAAGESANAALADAAPANVAPADSPRAFPPNRAVDPAPAGAALGSRSAPAAPPPASAPAPEARGMARGTAADPQEELHVELAPSAEGDVAQRKADDSKESDELVIQLGVLDRAKLQDAAALSRRSVTHLLESEQSEDTSRTLSRPERAGAAPAAESDASDPLARAARQGSTRLRREYGLESSGLAPGQWGRRISSGALLTGETTWTWKLPEGALPEQVRLQLVLLPSVQAQLRATAATLAARPLVDLESNAALAIVLKEALDDMRRHQLPDVSYLREARRTLSTLELARLQHVAGEGYAWLPGGVADPAARELVATWGDASQRRELWQRFAGPIDDTLASEVAATACGANGPPVLAAFGASLLAAESQRPPATSDRVQIALNERELGEAVFRRGQLDPLVIGLSADQGAPGREYSIRLRALLPEPLPFALHLDLIEGSAPAAEPHVTATWSAASATPGSTLELRLRLERGPTALERAEAVVVLGPSVRPVVDVLRQLCKGEARRLDAWTWDGERLTLAWQTLPELNGPVELRLPVEAIASGVVDARATLYEVRRPERAVWSASPPLEITPAPPAAP